MTNGKTFSPGFGTPVKKLDGTLAAILLTSAVAALSLPGTSFAQKTPAKPTRPPVDVSQIKTLYLVGYSHLDTQWRWAYPQVIREFIPDTMRNNTALMEKYPDYIFNFSGSRRYEMMKEYYPEDYKKVKQFAKSGQWFPAGSSVDEGDANVPSAESLVRHMLYGNHFFKREFGVTSQEFMLPDCFGFPYALPTILGHAGLTGFSTQKLTWGSAIGVPFKVGNWEGPDGKRILSALDPGAYVHDITEDLSVNTSWLARIQNTGSKSGAYVDYHYYGVGDRGGAPSDASVSWVEKSLKGTGPIKVISSRADEMFLAIKPDQKAKLPVYKGEMLLTEHSAGSVTSQSYMKRWNRQNELLADSAERAAVAAMWLGGPRYPSERLYQAWNLVLGSQMHDILPGTSLPKAYEFSWNDEVLALNQFAAITVDSVAAITSAMDTRAQGTSLVVYNPLSVARQDVVEATVPVSGNNSRGIQVHGPDGKPVPTQVLSRSGSTARVLFLAQVPSTSFVTFDVRPAAQPVGPAPIKVSRTGLENERFRVTIDSRGDIYVSSRGDYYNTPSNLFVIDTKTDEKKMQLDIP
ncbi:MAG: alpha-mannosidase, partial [Armatimonadota bacterium]